MGGIWAHIYPLSLAWFCWVLCLDRSHLTSCSAQVCIWLDMLSVNQHSSDQQDIDLTSLKGCLAQAKPTLVCMQHDQAASEDGVEQAAANRVCLVMYRCKEGIRGFHSFDTVHVRYI